MENNAAITNNNIPAKKKITAFSEYAGLPLIVWVAFAIYGSSILFYWLKLGGVSDDPARWGQFGDFVGGFINPVIGLATIILIALTLKQNDKALNAAMAELELTREALISGQAIQKATENALQNQLSIARLEKDFNTAVKMSDIYNEKILELDSKINNFAMLESSEVQVANYEKIKYDRKIFQEKRDALIHLLDQELDLLLNRLCDGLLEAVTTVKGIVYRGFEFETKYNSSFDTVTIKIKSLDDSSVRVLIESAVEKDRELLYKRYHSLSAATEYTKKIIDTHHETGAWPLQTQQL